MGKLLGVIIDYLRSIAGMVEEIRDALNEIRDRELDEEA